MKNRKGTIPFWLLKDCRGSTRGTIGYITEVQRYSGVDSIWKNVCRRKLNRFTETESVYFKRTQCVNYNNKLSLERCIWCFTRLSLTMRSVDTWTFMLIYYFVYRWEKYINYWNSIISWYGACIQIVWTRKGQENSFGRNIL